MELVDFILESAGLLAMQNLQLPPRKGSQTPEGSGRSVWERQASGNPSPPLLPQLHSVPPCFPPCLGQVAAHGPSSLRRHPVPTGHADGEDKVSSALPPMDWDRHSDLNLAFLIRKNRKCSICLIRFLSQRKSTCPVAHQKAQSALPRGRVVLRKWLWLVESLT